MPSILMELSSGGMDLQVEVTDDDHDAHRCSFTAVC